MFIVADQGFQLGFYLILLDFFACNFDFGDDFEVSWRRGINADGYFVYLENQEWYVAEVAQSFFDTTIVASGVGMQEPGYDRIWVESILGDYEVTRTPFDVTMPKGVVGAAGNYRNVDITL